MMRISDLLNTGDHSDDDDEQVAQILDAQYSEERRKLRRAASAVEYDDASSSSADDMGRLSETTSYASSLLDALSLQSMAKLSSKRSPTALIPSPSAAAASAQSRYLTIENLTNPDAMGETKQEPNDARASSKKRSTRSLLPATTDSDRRAKQRMIVKRCYYKKIDTIKALRDEAQSLEQQFHAAMHARKQQHEAIAAARKDGEVADEATALSELYLQSLTAKEALRKENQRLRRLADEYYMKNQGRLRVLLDSNKKGITLFTPALDN